MDGRFLLLVACVSITGFAATWSMMGGTAAPHAAVVAAGAPIAVQPDRPFTSCDEARQAGAAPLMAGRPGYNVDLDPDGTGLACPPLS